MRIVLIGQAAFGAKTLEALSVRGENVVAVFTRPDKAGAKPDPLKVFAETRNIPVFQPHTYKNDQVFLQYRELRPDLTILAFVTDIIPAHYLEGTTQGAICYHPSLLPRHRGGSAINWTIMMGDKRTGLTIFWPDGGIDTGPILLQKEIDIGPEDTTGSIYFDRLFPMGIEAILESVQLIKEGRAPKIPQEEEGATYEPLCNDRVAAIDWCRPAHDIHNLVRGCDPQPGAFTFFGAEKLRLFGARLLPETTPAEPPGTIIAISGEGMQIAAPGGSLLVTSLRGATGGKVAASAWSAQKGVKAGHHLGGSG